MNKRIEELARSVDPEAWRQCHPEDIEWCKKFADLIVNDCLSMVESNIHGPCGKYDYSYTDEDYAADNRAESILRDIKYHFGVRS